MDKEKDKLSNIFNQMKTYSWREIVEGIKSPYNTYVFVLMHNSGKSKSVRNLVVELVRKIPHHNIILFSTTSYKELNDDYAVLRESKYTKIYPEVPRMRLIPTLIGY